MKSRIITFAKKRPNFAAMRKVNEESVFKRVGSKRSQKRKAGWNHPGNTMNNIEDVIAERVTRCPIPVIIDVCIYACVCFVTASLSLTQPYEQ